MSTYIDRFSVPVETRAPSGRTNAYLIGPTDPSDDDGAVLVDPAARTETLDTAVRAKSIDHIVITHAHPDHLGALAAYARETAATVWARRGRESRFQTATGLPPDETFSEGDRIGPATVIDVPGHAPDHVAFVIGGWDSTPGSRPAPDARRIVCGDLVTREGSVVVAAPEGDMRGYLTALRRLHARDPVTLHPGHGELIQQPRAACARLIDHRLSRERRVLRAVESGARSPDAIVAAAYTKDVSGVRDLARATVVAHLEKLHREDHLRWDPKDGQAVPLGN